MAKVVKDDNVKKITVDKYARLNYLKKWLYDTSLPIDFLIEDKNEFNNSLKYRLFSYLLNNPHACYYINTYLNDFFDFSSNNYQPKDWLYTFATIIEKCKIKNFNFASFQNFKRDQFSKLLDSYYKSVGEMELNNSETNALFLLFEHDIITADYIEQLQNLTSDKISKPKVNKAISAEPVIPTIQPNTKLNPKVIAMGNSIAGMRENYNNCKYCPGNKKGCLVLESDHTQVDVMIVNLIPSASDVQNQTFLSERPSFKISLEHCLNMHKVNFMYYNAILCQNDAADDTTLKRMYNNCNGLSNIVRMSANAKFYIILGLKTAKSIGLKATAKSINTVVDENCYIFQDFTEKEIGDIKNQKVNQAFDNLQSALKYRVNDWIKDRPLDTESKEFSIDTGLLSKSKKNLTLFDIQIIGGRAIYVMLDSENNKHFIEENISFPVYIKSGKFNECDFTSDKMNYVVNLTYFEKQNLSQKLNENLKNNILKSNNDIEYGEEVF